MNYPTSANGTSWWGAPVASSANSPYQSAPNFAWGAPGGQMMGGDPNLSGYGSGTFAGQYGSDPNASGYPGGYGGYGSPLGQFGSDPNASVSSFWAGDPNMGGSSFGQGSSFNSYAPSAQAPHQWSTRQPWQQSPFGSMPSYAPAAPAYSGNSWARPFTDGIPSYFSR